MPIVHELLAQTTNHIGWVLTGIIAWGLAYWQLEDVGSQLIGDIVTLILSVVPLGIAVIAIDVAVARWKGNGNFLVVAFFLLLGIASVVYFLMVYFGLTPVGKHSEVQRVINDYKVLCQLPPKTVTLVIQLLVGAISTLACATLLIFGGWQLIQGSRAIGLICWLTGSALMILSRHPKQNWNYLWLWRSKLRPAGDHDGPSAALDLRASGATSP
jgi:hypothetical protein